jgi:transposase
MKQYVGLDVSLEETKIHILDETGARVWRGKCPSDPDPLEAVLRKHAPHAERIGIETGPLTTWLWTDLTGRGLPMVCLDARHAKKALDMRINKTDANDAEGLAHIVRSGWYKEVRVKTRDAMLSKTLVAGRDQLLQISTGLSNQIRGVMKTFGLVVPKGAGKVFEANVRRFLDGEHALAAVVLPLLETWRAVRSRTAELDRLLLRRVRHDAECRRLMTVPGVGAVVAASYVAAVESPDNFRHSRAVGAWLGLTTSSYRSGEAEYDGHISRRGDLRLRSLLYEAAVTLLTRVREASALRSWGLALWKKGGFKRAAVAVARKLAVVLHAMWKTGADFDPAAGAAAA